jgi:hypothetical protein
METREIGNLIGSDKVEGTAVFGPDDREIGSIERGEGVVIAPSRSVDEFSLIHAAPRDGLSSPVKGTGVGNRQTFPRGRGRRLRFGRGPCRGRAASVPPGPPSRVASWAGCTQSVPPIDTKAS